MLRRLLRKPLFSFLGAIAIALSLIMGASLPAISQSLIINPTITVWTNHLDFLPGDPSINTSFNAINSGVGSGLSGLIVTSTTLGSTAPNGGNKVIEKGLDIPPGYLLTGIRLCYQSSNSRTFLSQIRLAQLTNPPTSAIVRLDDARLQLRAAGPVCLNSRAVTVNQTAGAVRLSLRFNFGSTSDRFVLRGVGLLLRRI